MKQKRQVKNVILETIKKQKKLSAGILVTVTGAVVAALLPPLILAKIIDTVTAGNEAAFSVILLYFVLLALTGILEAAREGLLTVFGQKITHALRSSLMDKFVSLTADSVNKQEPGTLVSRFVGDVDTVENLFTSGIISMFADVCKIISILVVIWFQNRGLTLVLLVLLPFLFWFTRHVQKNMLAAQIENRKAVGRASGHVPETLRNIRTIHCLAKETYMEERYDTYIGESYAAMERTNFYDAVYSPVILICNAVVVAVVMLLSMAAYAEENPTVVTVNGDSITQAELNAMMSALDAQMTQHGIDTSSENVQNAIREAAMQELVEDRLLTQDMTAQGCYDMTEEEEASIADAAKKSQADLQQQMESYFASYMDSQEDSSATAAELAETYLKDSGYTLEYMENYIRNTVASTKYEQWLMEGEADTTQEEIQAAYEERVASSKAAYENDVSAFETALANNQEVWYRPDGYRAVLQIMLSAQGDDDTQKLASVKETTDAIYDRLEKGESFESLIAAYGETYSDAYRVEEHEFGGYAAKSYYRSWEEPDDALPMKMHEVIYCIDTGDEMIRLTLTPLIGLGISTQCEMFEKI